MEEQKPSTEKKPFHFENLIKGPLTSLIGAGAISASTYFSIIGTTPWLWNGLIGCAVGGILIFTPDSIKTIIDGVVKKKLGE